MLSYHSDPELKAARILRMQAHIDADELIRGVGFENGRGCAVGCTLNSYDHKAFETELGIPEWMAELLDELHENTSEEVWPTLAIKFLKTVPVGKDLEPIKHQLSIFIQKRNLDRVLALGIPSELKEQVASAIRQVIEAHEIELAGGIADFEAAESAAEAAARLANSAARLANSADWSAAQSAAQSADGSVARSVAWLVTESADWSARSVDESAQAAELDIIANQLLKLLARV